MSRKLSALGIPDLPSRAFQRDASGKIRPQGGKGDAPAAPDYEAAAKETAAGNLETARYATQANRPTQITPWGTSSWTNDRTFDQAGYDAAMAAYNQSLQQPQRPAATAYSPGGGESQHNEMQLNAFGGGSAQPGAYGYGGGIPNPADFYSSGDNWTQTVTLSPEMQALFDQQNRLQQGLFGAQDAALGRVNQTMGQQFDMSGVPQGGQALNLSGLPGMGTALDINGLPGYGSVFAPTGQGLNVYDPTLQTNNATELLMQRINPQMERQQEALRAQLANQGIAQGSAAYNNAMQSFGQTRNDAATQAALHGIGLGMQQQGLQFNQGLQNRQLLAGEQNQQFGQQTTNQQLAAALQAQQFAQQQGLRMGEAGLQNQQFNQAEQARQRAMQEQAYLRSLPMNELNALRTGNQVGMPQFGGFSQQATTGGPDMMGAAQNQYNAALGAYNADQAGMSNMMGGLLGIGSAFAGSPTGAAAIAGLFGR